MTNNITKWQDRRHNDRINYILRRNLRCKDTVFNARAHVNRYSCLPTKYYIMLYQDPRESFT